MEMKEVKSLTASIVAPNILGGGVVRELVVEDGRGGRLILTLYGREPADLAIEDEMRVPRASEE